MIVLISLATQAQEMNPEKIVQANLDAYNEKDIAGFMSYFSDHITIVNFEDGSISARGKKAVKAIYKPYFEASPNLHSKILKRIVIGNKVIDHEYITGRYGSNEALELILIYEVEEAKIIKVTVLKN